jgi:hypothetical protein
MVKWQQINRISFKTGKLEAKDISFEQSETTRAQEIAGAIFETQLDLSHPINFGMPKTQFLEIHLLSLNLIKQL